MTKPYTYLLYCKPTKEFYYGVRYAENCDPNEFWIKYFTSSKRVKERITMFGKDSFEFEIRKIFESSLKARIWEDTVIRRLDLVNKENFLNKSRGLVFIKRRTAMSGKKCVFDNITNKFFYIENKLALSMISENPNQFSLRGKNKPTGFGIKVSKSLKNKKKSKKHINNRRKSYMNNPRNKGYKIYNDGEKLYRVRNEEIILNNWVLGVTDKIKESRKGRKSLFKGLTYEEIYGEEKGKKLRDSKGENFKINNPGKKMKNKTYDDLYGKEKADELRVKRAITGKKNKKEYIILHKQIIIFTGDRLGASKFLIDNFNPINKREPIYNKLFLEQNNLIIETNRLIR